MPAPEGFMMMPGEEKWKTLGNITSSEGKQKELGPKGLQFL